MTGRSHEPQTDVRRGLTSARAAAGSAAAAPSRPAAGAATPLFPDDAQFWYETVRMFGADEYGGASFGEVLATSPRIKAGDYDSWYDAWNEIADRIAGEADGQLPRSATVSARDSYLRASNYYRCVGVLPARQPQGPADRRAYRRLDRTATRRCGASSIRRSSRSRSLTRAPRCRATCTGVDGSETPRRLLIMHTGFDGSAEEMHWMRRARGRRARLQRPGLRRPRPVRPAAPRGPDLPARLGEGRHPGGRLRAGAAGRRPQTDRAAWASAWAASSRRAPRPSSIASPRCIANDGVYDYAAPYLAAVPRAAARRRCEPCSKAEPRRSSTRCSSTP